jgi:hypothetical protein
MNLICNSQEHCFFTFEGPPGFANEEENQKLASPRVDLPLEGVFRKGY